MGKAKGSRSRRKPASAPSNLSDELMNLSGPETIRAAAPPPRQYADIMSCEICIASRRTAVDAYLEGYTAGLRDTVQQAEPKLCLPHEIRFTKKLKEAIRGLASNPGL